MTAPFKPFRGIAAPLPLANVNTDVIIPSTFLRSESTDLALGLFARWRFDEAGDEGVDRDASLAAGPGSAVRPHANPRAACRGSAFSADRGLGWGEGGSERLVVDLYGAERL